MKMAMVEAPNGAAAEPAAPKESTALPTQEAMAAAVSVSDARSNPSSDEAAKRGWLSPLLVGGALLLAGALYFLLFVADDMATNVGNEQSPVKSANTESAVTRQMFAVTEVNIRDQPTTVGSSIIGKLPRGSAVTGILRVGTDGTSSWFELAEGKGFIADINLSDNAMPDISKSLNDKIWTTDSAMDIWSQPDSASSLVDRVSTGTKLTLSGLTTNDYIEIKPRNGGVGYIAGGAAILARLGGKPISISFDPANCSFGSEIDAEFAKMGARLGAQWAALEGAEYPSEEVREKAMATMEGRSIYQRFQRSFEGLSVTAIAQHNESQSIYFADPAAKVMDLFRDKGFRVSSDGIFPSEIYAGISGTRGEGTGFGRSELGCGV